MRLTVTTRGWARALAHPIGQALVEAALALFIAGGIAFVHYYNVYAGVIDERLSSPIFQQTSIVFAAPKIISVGEALPEATLLEWLQRAGYSQDEASPVGRFTLAGGLVQIEPGPEAWHSPIPAQVQFQDGQVTAITNASNQEALTSYALEPELLTSLFNAKREKRKLVHYSDLPPMLINAVLDIEDRGFFEHGAVNWTRVPAAFFRDVRAGRAEQGASTITMQVARNIFGLGFQRTARRKLEEVLVSEELEERLTKQQIFELYANQLYMGQRGSYSIHGFGEAADAYFGKSVGQLTLPQCALLAGIIHGPNPDSPYRHPERAVRRRNEVLRVMLRDGTITPVQEAAAVATPLRVQPANTEASDAPYFVDMVRDRVSDQIPERDLNTGSYRIYTTLDPDLQAAAAQAVTVGMKEVDEQLAALRRGQHSRGRKAAAQAPAQVALIALDPHTGDVLALAGGRNYAESQLNHALAERPTGSIFKPFVYATALETGLLSNLTPITQTSTVLDDPSVFDGGEILKTFDTEEQRKTWLTVNTSPGDYFPNNFENKYYGRVSLRVALEHSLNNATIALAEQVGLNAVTDLAHQAGIVNAQPTPSEAIGTYTATPLQMAGAYTIFANAGVRETPRLVAAVQSNGGKTVMSPNFPPQPVLDPRIAYLTTNLMESVLDDPGGTAIRVREEGYDQPAAGKTGTSHDAWFAGYTNNLLCVVWVGLDNYDQLNIEGAHAALPVWVAFMKAAAKLPSYSNNQPFAPPPGVVAVKIDTESGQVATPLCPPSQVEVDYYLEGTEPHQTCRLHPSPLMPRGLIAGAANAASSLFHIIKPPPPAPVAPPVRNSQAMSPTANAQTQPPKSTPAPKPAVPQKKRGLFGKIFHALGGGGGGGKPN